MGFNHIPAKTVRFWAWVDSGVTWMLALPPLAPKFLATLYWINGIMGGESTPPTFLPIHLVFVCLTGTMISVWVIARLLNPVGIMAVVDGWGRLVVCGVLLYCTTVLAGPVVLYLFVFTEGLGAVAQLKAAYFPKPSTQGMP